MAEGHPFAQEYPLAFMWNEARIARERVNSQTITETLMLFQAVQTVWSGKIDGLNKAIQELRDGG
jgi:hypothetical protein